MGRLFNGSSDVITATAINPNGFSGLTMAGWAYVTSTALGYGAILAFAPNFAIYTYGTNVAAFTNHAGSGFSLQAGTITANTWVHVALTDTIGTLTLYLNGVVTGTPISTSGTFNTETNIRMGSDSGVADFLSGGAADCAYWNTVLSSGQVAQLAAGYRPIDIGSTANLQGWWPLSGYSSPEPDISGNNNNGTLTGTAQAAMPPSLGRGARNFTASTDQMNVTFSPTSALTVSWWVFSSTLPSPTTLAALSWDNAAQAIYLSGSSYPLNVFAAGGLTGAHTANVINQGTWYNIIWTQTVSSGAGTYTFYLNGTSILSDNGTLLGGFASGSHTWNVGNIVPTGTNPLNGYMADMAVWSTVLNGTQINQLAAGVRPPNVNSGNLIGWWPLHGFSNSTELDLSGSGNNGTLVGTHPILGPPQLWRLG